MYIDSPLNGAWCQHPISGAPHPVTSIKSPHMKGGLFHLENPIFVLATRSASVQNWSCTNTSKVQNAKCHSLLRIDESRRGELAPDFFHDHYQHHPAPKLFSRKLAMMSLWEEMHTLYLRSFEMLSHKEKVSQHSFGSSTCEDLLSENDENLGANIGKLGKK